LVLSKIQKIPHPASCHAKWEFQMPFNCVHMVFAVLKWAKIKTLPPFVNLFLAMALSLACTAHRPCGAACGLNGGAYLLL
jgi:hypothetical protein